MRELLLRLGAILRRRNVASEGGGLAAFGRLRIDRDAHRVWVDEQEVTLTALELRLLSTLSTAAGACSRARRCSTRSGA